MMPCCRAGTSSVDEVRTKGVDNRLTSIRYTPQFLYQINCHEDEESLCLMEMRALFGHEPKQHALMSDRAYPPSRSPFIRQRLHVIIEADHLQAVAAGAAELDMQGASYKVVYVQTDGTVTYEERLAVERQVGRHIRGRADMKHPDRFLGIACVEGRWYLGSLERAEPVWLVHNQKPQAYSTALSTRVARAVVNIAAPLVDGVKVIDPCCGIGTVLIEALSMGIDIVGCDLNPLAVRGARINLAHYGMPDVVRLQDMREAAGSYDAVILDLPYNLCSVMDSQVRIAMITHAGRLAPRVVIVTTERIDSDIAASGLIVEDRCIVRKARFERQVLLCVRASN